MRYDGDSRVDIGFLIRPSSGLSLVTDLVTLPSHVDRQLMTQFFINKDQFLNIATKSSDANEHHVHSQDSDK